MSEDPQPQPLTPESFARNVLMANWGRTFRCARCPKKTDTTEEGSAEMAKHLEDHMRGRI